jgi:hypothetical protein
MSHIIFLIWVVSSPSFRVHGIYAALYIEYEKFTLNFTFFRRRIICMHVVVFLRCCSVVLQSGSIIDLKNEVE